MTIRDVNCSWHMVSHRLSETGHSLRETVPDHLSTWSSPEVQWQSQGNQALHSGRVRWQAGAAAFQGIGCSTLILSNVMWYAISCCLEPLCYRYARPDRFPGGFWSFPLETIWFFGDMRHQGMLNSSCFVTCSDCQRPASGNTHDDSKN